VRSDLESDVVVLKSTEIDCGEVDTQLDKEYSSHDGITGISRMSSRDRGWKCCNDKSCMMQVPSMSSF
jgi:hypothetical protein